LVVALGVVIVLSFLQPPISQDKLFTSRAYARKQPKPRQLASEKKAPSNSINQAHSTRAIDSAIVNGGKAQAIEVRLDCSGKNHGLFEKAVNQMRLTGKTCAKNQEISSTEVHNEANGTSATVFFPTPRSFTTDYISLAPGPNRIRILNFLKNGIREEQEFLVERTSAVHEVPDKAN
jgi:hypothetical protein